MPLPRLALPSLLGALLLGAACTSTDATRVPGRLWLVLVDASRSIDAKTAAIYTAAWRTVIDRAAPGDHVTLLRIGTGLRTAAMPVADVVLPAAPGLLDNAVRRRREVTALKGRLRNVTLIDRNEQTMDTPILEALQTAGRRLRDVRHERRVILMSDMLEDAGAVDFLKRPPTDGDLEELVEEWSDAESLHAWQGASVHVVYAGAPVSNATARAVERFWRAFFPAIGATLRSWDAQLPRDTTYNGTR